MEEGDYCCNTRPGMGFKIPPRYVKSGSVTGKEKKIMNDKVQGSLRVTSIKKEKKIRYLVYQKIQHIRTGSEQRRNVSYHSTNGLYFYMYLTIETANASPRTYNSYLNKGEGAYTHVTRSNITRFVEQWFQLQRLQLP